MKERERSDRAGRAMMAAVSALGLALGVSPAAADPPPSGWGSSGSTDQKAPASGGTASAWGSTDQTNQLKTNQQKSDQLKSSQLKSNQLKSTQLKSSQIKQQGMEGGEHPQGMEGGEMQGDQPH